MKVLNAMLVAVGAMLVVSLLTSLPVMWLWNWLMPKLFGLIEINMWESLGLTFLCALLFKNGSNDD